MYRWLTGLMIVVVLAMSGGPARADALACPDLATAEQVGNCPSLRELRIMFRSTCGAEANPNAPKPGLCDTFEAFQQQKSTAMWEAGEAGFVGYLPCAVAAERIRSARVTGLKLASSRRITKITCGYDGGLSLTLRRRGACKLPDGNDKGQIDCAGDPAACAVSCE